MRRVKSSRERIRRRVRARVSGTAERPRVSVFRSNRYTYAQLIDDTKGVTLCALSDRQLIKEGKLRAELVKKERAFAVGKFLAKKALALSKRKVVFDRNGYKYHGRVKALADGLREGGLEV